MPDPKITQIALVGPPGYGHTANVLKQVRAFNDGRENVNVRFIAFGDATYGLRFDIIFVVPGLILTPFDREWLAVLHTRLPPGGLLIGM
jgi:hypothetical protein